MKIKLMSSLLLVFGLQQPIALAMTVDHDGILRDTNGNVATMNRNEALKACANFGQHLPTIVELTKLYQSSGLILKVPYDVTQEDLNAGHYELVIGINPDLSTLRFYYNHENFLNPAGDTGSHWFWSASFTAECSGGICALNFEKGYIGYFNPWASDGAVRCVDGEESSD